MIIMKKKVSFLIALLLIFSCIGCEGRNKNTNISFFELNKASDVADNYIKDICLGNMEKANEVVDNKLKNISEFDKINQNKIRGFKLDAIEEGVEHAFFKYLVCRGKDDDSRVDLDTIAIKVAKKQEDYVVESIQAQNVSQVYKEEDLLRIKNSEIGKSEVLIRKQDLPKDVYPKKSEVVLNKESIITEQFDKLAIGFGGNMVGLTSKGQGKTLIALATVKQQNATITKEQNNEGIDIAIEDALEKPIVNTLTDYDILDGYEVERILFSSDDTEMIVQAKGGNGASKIRIYRNPTGELLKYNFQTIFPEDKFTVSIKMLNKEGVFINVESLEGTNEADGEYKIDLKEQKINKMG